MNVARGEKEANTCNEILRYKSSLAKFTNRAGLRFGCAKDELSLSAVVKSLSGSFIRHKGLVRVENNQPL